MLRTFLPTRAKVIIVAAALVTASGLLGQTIMPALGRFASLVISGGTLIPGQCYGNAVGCYFQYFTSDNTSRAYWGGTTTGPTALKGNGNVALVYSNTTDVFTTTGATNSTGFQVSSPCTSAASPSVCGASSSGVVAMAAASSTLIVNTTNVTAASKILVTADSGLGTALGVTCNTTIPTLSVSARTASTSFTITASAAPTTNPLCMSYLIIN